MASKTKADPRSRKCPACKQSFRVSNHLGRPPTYCKRRVCVKARWARDSKVYRFRKTHPSKHRAKTKKSGVGKSRHK